MTTSTRRVSMPATSLSSTKLPKNLRISCAEGFDGDSILFRFSSTEKEAMDHNPDSSQWEVIDGRTVIIVAESNEIFLTKEKVERLVAWLNAAIPHITYTGENNSTQNEERI